MASIQEAIKRLTWLFTSTGADKVAADHNKVADANEALAVKSQKTEKSALDLDKAFGGLERRFNTTIRAQQDYQKVQDKVNAAVAQNPQLQERANSVLALASEHFGKATTSADGFSKVLDASRGAALGYATGLGSVGAVLGSFGPWGLAAAAGIGLVVTAFTYLTEAANKAGDEASALKRFSDVSGLSTVQVRGLTEAGQELGVGADAISGGLQKFTVNLDEARDGGGKLFDQIKKIDSQLAISIASSRDSGEALDLLTKAYNRTTDATTKAAIAKAAFGKGGAALGPVLGVIGEGGGVDAYSEAASKALGITEEWTKEVARLRNENKDLEDDIKTVESSFFTKEMLARQNEFLKKQLQIIVAIRDTRTAQGESSDEFDLQRNIKSTEGNVPAATGPEPTLRANFQGATDQIKAANEASLQLTATSDALAAATARAAQAQDALKLVESNAAASADALRNARQGAGDALALLATVEQTRIAALNGAATGEEMLKQKTDQLTAAMLQGKISAEDYNRALHGDANNQLAALQEQRAVIEAVGGAAKMAAQYAADYAAQIRAAKPEVDALAIAAEKLAIAQASANAAAKEQTWSLQNNLAVSQAWTASAQMLAQQQATYNQLVHQGVDAETAGANAAAQYADAKAKAVASAEKLVQSSEDQLATTKAQGTSMEGVVASAIAYRDAIQAGADSTQAAAIAANTLEASLIRAARAAQQVQQAADEASIAATNAAVAANNSQFKASVMPSGPLTFSGSMDRGVTDIIAHLKNQAAQESAGIAGLAGAAYATGGIAAALDAVRNAPTTFGANSVMASLPQKSGGHSSPIDYVGILGAERSTTDDKISTYDQLVQLQNSQTTDKTAQASNLQSELAWLQTLPTSIARDQKITSLQQSIDQLKQSTDGLNATNSELLSPYYTQDPRTSHIGFRSQGMASGGYVDVPGSPSANDNMIATIPVASGERIYVDAMPGLRGGTTKQQTVNISNHIVVGPGANPDQVGRTVYQSTQRAVRQIQSVSQ